MKDFNRKVQDTSARVNKSVAEAADRMEKESAEFIKYLNDEVVPAVRQHSTKALRVASQKLIQLADYMEQQQRSARKKKCVGTPYVLLHDARPSICASVPQRVRPSQAGEGQ